MGQVHSATVSEPKPDPLNPPTFDPMLGFPNGRKPRVMVATEEEMKSAKLDMEDRDYCAHLLLKFRACRQDKFPWVYKCHHEKHAYEKCEVDDYVLRMKEYERERRLLAREARRQAKLMKEDMGE